MRRLFLIFILPVIFFLFEVLWTNLFGGMFRPDFLVILIVFVDLFLGIRYGLAAALWAGLLKDSFCLNPFGTHVLSYMICAFMTVIARRYFFHSSSYSLRVLLSFLMSLLNATVLFVLHSLQASLDFKDAFSFVVFPQVLSTTVIAGFTIHHLKKCVLKFSA